MRRGQPVLLGLVGLDLVDQRLERAALLELADRARQQVVECEHVGQGRPTPIVLPSGKLTVQYIMQWYYYL